MLHRKVLSLLISMIAVVLVTLWVSASSKEVSPSNKAGMASNAVKDMVDFKALLTRTDHIETCTRDTEAEFTKSLGPNWLPDKAVKLGCECIQDGALYVMEDLYPNRPVMHNAMLQLALNMDVAPIVFDENSPGSITAMNAYLAEYGKSDLGFDDEEFLAAVKEVGAAASARSPEEVLSTIPSCAEALNVVRSPYPNVDHEADPYYPERAYALRRLEFDPKIDVTGLDVALTSRVPLELCKTLIVHTDLAGTSDLEAVHDLCDKTLRKVTCCLKHLSDEDQLAAIRIGLGGLYVKTHASTAKTKDALYYVLEHYERFGWTKDQLLRVAKEMQNNTDREHWLALEQLLETGTIEDTLETQL